MILLEHTWSIGSRLCTSLTSLLRFALLLCVCAVYAQNYEPNRCAPPPLSKYTQADIRKYHSMYPNLATRDGWGVRHGDFTFCLEPPSDGGSQDHHFDSSVDLHLADGRCFRAPAAVTVRVQLTNETGCASVYGTEMLQLDVAGGDLPPGMKVRQSPTQRSLGRLTIQPAAGGGYLMDGFFDLWTDLSLDGGLTWTGATNSTRMVLTNNSPELFSFTNTLPALQSRYHSPDVAIFCTNGACCTNGILLSNIVHTGFTMSEPPPPLGGSSMHTFGSQVLFEISLDGGATFIPQQMPAAVTVLVHHTRDIEGTQYFDTQMVQLDIGGGTLPPGVRVRQSPVKPSLGKTYLRVVPDGFKISSYFDIFTELSLDGGLSWAPACCPEHMELEAPPTDYPSTIVALHPAAYLRLNETTQPPGQIIANNLGTLGPAGNGMYAGGTPGVSGALAGSENTAARFSGGVVVPSSIAASLGGAFTFEAWLKAAVATTGTPCPVSCGTFGTNRSGWLIYQTASGWNLRMYSGIGSQTALSLVAGGPIAPGVWYHVAVAYDGASTAELYVNDGLNSGILTSPFNPNNGGALTLGMRSDGAFRWAGSIDEVAIYPGTQVEPQLTYHYQQGIDPSPFNIPYDQLVLSESPMIYFRLDALALPVAVNSGLLFMNADGVYEPQAFPGVPGLPWSGLGNGNLGCRFNGSGYVDVPGDNLDLIGPVTVVAWVKADPANGVFQTIVGKGDTSYRLDVDWNGYPRFADGQANPDVVGPLRIDDGQWHFLGGVYDGTLNHLYVDGMPAATAGAGAAVAGNGNDVWIGGAPDYGTARNFHGIVDEVAIFPYALTPPQIQTIFKAASLPSQLRPSGDIALRPAGRDLELIWCSGTLQASDHPEGPYADLAGASSPFRFTPSEARKFYRVKH